MTIILLRHGTRNYGIGDSPLNFEGMEEAVALAAEDHFSSVTQIYCSPKKRAQMTIQPLAEKLNLKIETFPQLDQQLSSESREDFLKRVTHSLSSITGNLPSDAVCILCSHSDWLSTAVELMPTQDGESQSLIFHCANYKTFSVKDGLWQLKSSPK